MVKVPNSRKLAETFASSAMGCCVDVALRRKLFDFRRCPKSERRIQIRGRTGRPPKVPMLHHDTSIYIIVHLLHECYVNLSQVEQSRATHLRKTAQGGRANSGQL